MRILAVVGDTKAVRQRLSAGADQWDYLRAIRGRTVKKVGCCGGKPGPFGNLDSRDAVCYEQHKEGAMREKLHRLTDTLGRRVRKLLGINPPMSPEERRRAHIMILAAGAGSNLLPGPDGKIHIEVVHAVDIDNDEDDENEDEEDNVPSAAGRTVQELGTEKLEQE